MSSKVQSSTVKFEKQWLKHVQIVRFWLREVNLLTIPALVNMICDFSCVVVFFKIKLDKNSQYKILALLFAHKRTYRWVQVTVPHDGSTFLISNGIR